nr:hypothetical protein [uncultured Sphingomonas sp.]
MRLNYLVLAIAIVVAGPIAAHPHATIDQQAILSIDRNSLVIDYRVLPSFKDGAHMFDHLDTNGDHVLDNGEKRAFAAALLRSTSVVVDGKKAPLQLQNVSTPTRQVMARGAGLVLIRARSAIRLTPSQAHRLAIDIRYARFKNGWFIQPFYGRVLSKGPAPELHRSSSGSALTIRVPSDTQ